jgi:hypothetical protein
VTRRASTRRSSKRRSSRRLSANTLHRHHIKAYPKHKGFEDATWKWVLTAFPLEKRRIVVTAFRAHEGVPRDRGLEQHFDGDTKGLKAAKAYAHSLITDRVAVATYVQGEVYLDGYWPKPWGGTWSYEWVPVEELANEDDRR